MIKRLAFYDMDGTLIDTPMPDTGKVTWKEVTGQDYPHLGWWGRKESLDTNVFDIKPFPSVLSQLRNDTARPDTRTVLLTNRLEKLRPEVVDILRKNNIKLDDLNLKTGGNEKDTRILRYLDQYPSVEEVSVFDDRDKELEILKNLKHKVPNVRVNVYRADNGNISLVETNNKVKSIINDEISKFTYL
jgi:hypothetical protein